MKKLLFLFSFIVMAGCNAGNLMLADSGSPSASASEASGATFNSPPQHISEFKVWPVKEPQLYRYGPCSGTKLEIWDINGEADVEYYALRSNYDTVRSGEELEQQLSIDEWGTPEDMEKLEVPLMVLKSTFDKRGHIFRGEASTPWVDFHDKRETETGKGIIAAADELVMDKLLLPETAIVTGDRLVEMGLEYFDSYVDIPEETVDALLEGEFTKDGIRYVASRVEKSFKGTLKTGDLPVTVEVLRRTIWEKESMDIVYDRLDADVILDEINESFMEFKIISEKEG